MKALFRPGMILLAFAAGYLLPQAGPYKFLIRYILQVMLFIIFLQVKVQGLRPRAGHWRILGANIVIGLTAWGLAGIAGPTLVSLFHDQGYGYAVTLYLFAGLFFVNLVIALVLWRSRRTVWQSVPEAAIE